MNLNKWTYRLAIWMILIAWVLTTSCSLQIDRENQPITEEDLQMLSQIIAESLSDANAGAVSAMHDAVSGISSNGFSIQKTASLPKVELQELSGRGTETNIQYSFNAFNGEHFLRFDRLVDLPNYQKIQTDSLIYVYRQQDGSFIIDPEVQAPLIESIRFYGSRVGQIEQPSSISQFSRHDTLFIWGLSEISDVIYMNGSHIGGGTYTAQLGLDSSWVERNYHIEFSFLDILLPKNTPLPTQKLDQSLQGQITYVVEITDPDQPDQPRRLNGRIDLVGDGTATLQLAEAPSNYQVNLNSGQTRDQDDEFEGRIRSIQLNQNRFSIVNGLTVQLSASTVIDAESAFQTLEEVQAALRQQIEVWVEGEGSLNNRIFEATEIKFEREDQDEDDDDEGTDRNSDDGVEFEQRIQSIDNASKVLTLISGLTLGFDQNSRVAQDGDYINFGQLTAALNRGEQVIAEGYAVYKEEQEVPLRIRFVEFERIGEDDEDKGSDDEDEETSVVEGVVASTNLGASTLTLTDGISIRVNRETEWDGQANSLQQVREALRQGFHVELKAEVVRDPLSTADYLAIEIEIEWNEGGS